MRFAYIKGGDVVSELTSSREYVSTSGNREFLDSVLAIFKSSDGLIISSCASKREVQHGIVRACNIGAPPTAFPYRIQRWLTKRSFTRELDRFAPSIILCGATGDFLDWCVRHAQQNGVRLISFLHNEIVHERDRELLRSIGAIVCHGPFLRDQLLDSGVCPDRIFEFEIDYASFASLEPDAAHPTSSRTIAYVGRIERSKGVFDFLEAATPILKSNPLIRVIFVGVGSAEAQLQQRSQASDVEGRVELMGSRDRNEVASLIRASSLVVTPTRTEFPEGRCMVVLEALSMGIPVIAPNHGPFPYAVRDRYNGLLYLSNSVRDLRRAITEAMEDPSLHASMSSNAVKESKRNVPKASFRQAVSAALDKVHSCIRDSSYV